MNKETTFLFVSSNFKGEAMIRAIKSLGCYVLLLTEEKLRQEPWPYDVIDESFYTPNLAHYQDVIHTIAYLCRGRQIDQIIPLDEFEVELVSMLREHLRLPGMGVTAARHFRDKLVMRELAHAAGIPVPEFVQIKNYDRLRGYMESVPAPWVLKPRAEASAMGIKKIHEPEQLWRTLDVLGDSQSYYLMERYLPGEVFHVDSIVFAGKILFASVQKYGRPPMDVYHGGGVFNSRVMPAHSGEVIQLRHINAQIIEALGMVHGVTHSEFIQSADGTFYFLESAARVGGANLADMIEAATNINLWREWGYVEYAALHGQPYKLPEVKQHYAGILMTLAKQEHPDLSAYTDSEVVWRATKPYHAGVIVASEAFQRVEELLDSYTRRFAADFMAVADPWGPQRTGHTT